MIFPESGAIINRLKTSLTIPQNVPSEKRHMRAKTNKKIGQLMHLNAKKLFSKTVIFGRKNLFKIKMLTHECRYGKLRNLLRSMSLPYRHSLIKHS